MDAREYHEQTKHTPASVRSVPSLDFDNQPIPYKIYRGLPTQALARRIRPAPVPALAAITNHTGHGPADHLGLDELTQLCWLSAGITKTLTVHGRQHPFRAAACTGALYHIDLYPVVGPGTGLDPGVYHFDPRTLSLDVLRTGDYRGVLADAAQSTNGISTAPLSIALTSTWWRNAWKYGNRTYRHAFWDSGTILANLLAVAASLDLPAHITTGFTDERIATLLGLDTTEEAPLEIVPIGRRAPVPDPDPIDPISPTTQPLSPNPETFPVIHDAYTQSSLTDGEAARAWRASSPPHPIGTTSQTTEDHRAIEPASPSNASGRSLLSTIRRRGSSRDYTREPIGFRETSTVLDRAIRGVPFDLDTDHPLGFNDVYLLVNAVEPLEPGTYHYHPETRTLELLEAGSFREAAGHLALDQRLAADAALCVYFLTDLTAITEHLGYRGYRIAQLEAAVTAGRLYLAAYAHTHLGATGLTFYDDTVTEFFAPRAAGQTPMFLWTMGHPAQ